MKGNPPSRKTSVWTRPLTGQLYLTNQCQNRPLGTVGLQAEVCFQRDVDEVMEN